MKVYELKLTDAQREEIRKQSGWLDRPCIRMIIVADIPERAMEIANTFHGDEGKVWEGADHAVIAENPLTPAGIIMREFGL